MKLAPAKNILGISAGYHDAAATVINNRGEILFAGHSERYSKKKNDSDFCQGLIDEIVEYAPETVAYYERPWNKQLRQWYSGQGIDWTKFTTGQILKQQLSGQINPKQIYNFNHHLSHAAAGFQTSPYDHATVVVIDAIGEWDTISIWAAEYDKKGVAKYRRLWRQVYPHSIGLFYSAVTGRIGLRPLDEEYITMGMAAWGLPKYTDTMTILMEENLHVGIDHMFLPTAQDVDIAASAQVVAEKEIYSIMQRAKDFGSAAVMLALILCFVSWILILIPLVKEKI